MITLYPKINQVELPQSRAVEELQLPWSIKQCLRAEEIETEAQLARIPDAYLLKIPNVGVKAVQKIRDLVPFIEVP